MTDSTKRAVSIAFFWLGMVLGLAAWVALPKMIAAMGRNDSSLSAVLSIACMVLFLPLCILAFWKRRVAGLGFLLLAVMWTGSIFLQYHFEVTHHVIGRSFAGDASVFGYSPVFLLFGVFAIGTEGAGWPPMRKPKKSD